MRVALARAIPDFRSRIPALSNRKQVWQQGVSHSEKNLVKGGPKRFFLELDEFRGNIKLAKCPFYPFEIAILELERKIEQ